MKPANITESTAVQAETRDCYSFAEKELHVIVSRINSFCVHMNTLMHVRQG